MDMSGRPEGTRGIPEVSSKLLTLRPRRIGSEPVSIAVNEMRGYGCRYKPTQGALFTAGLQ